MKRSFSLVLAFLMVVCLFSGCGTKPETAPETIRIYAMKGPTGMGMSKVITDAAADPDTIFDFTIASSPDEITAEIIKGNYDIAAVPANLAAVLYQKTQGSLMIGAVNTLGVLYLLENGNTIQSISDLNGKTIYATGQASTPEYVLNYILEANQVECEVIYLAEHAELATQMTAGTVTIGMLPVPNTTAVLSGNSDVRVALNLTEEWEKAAALKGDDGALYQGCVIIRREFAEQYPNTLKDFMKAYEESVNYVNEKPDEASLLIEQAGIVPKAAVAKKAIPDANIVFITGDEMATGLKGFFTVLFNANPTSVGGQIPDDAIYYKG